MRVEAKMRLQAMSFSKDHAVTLVVVNTSTFQEHLIKCMVIKDPAWAHHAKELANTLRGFSRITVKPRAKKLDRSILIEHLADTLLFDRIGNMKLNIEDILQVYGHPQEVSYSYAEAIKVWGKKIITRLIDECVMKDISHLAVVAHIEQEVKKFWEAHPPVLVIG